MPRIQIVIGILITVIKIYSQVQLDDMASVCYLEWYYKKSSVGSTMELNGHFSQAYSGFSTAVLLTEVSTSRKIYIYTSKHTCSHMEFSGISHLFKVRQGFVRTSFS